MSPSLILLEPHLTLSAASARAQEPTSAQPWMATSGVFLLLLVALGIFGKIKLEKLFDRLKFEELKNVELQKKLKLALKTIGDMERNPDLIHSREINVEYLRMRMAEDIFHSMILNQLKVKVREKVTVALRSSQVGSGMVGIPTAGRQVEQIFDVEDKPDEIPNGKPRVLFRIQIKLMKLPGQDTSIIVAQVIHCIQKFLSPSVVVVDKHWQPVIQDRIATMHWDQNAKPTPLLVLEQLNEGVTAASSNRRSR
ncbi:hypothetical protein [Leptolyngbya sp. FACHB-261]|uniref:hypothetical protein n=1 Tax=Leptolyngbya sp. FACHB-261 TaxID=2692806 RepID=UPI001689BF58|nr:hypothetical protein [Leptolyngbya sp. FACHB-261]MBD2099948.1 hypothetical protein [Leptolyngbya sp. FACHB-261]